MLTTFQHISAVWEELKMQNRKVRDTDVIMSKTWGGQQDEL